jgi:hypothetical protein
VRGPQQGRRADAENQNRDAQRDGGEQETEAGEHFWVRFRLGSISCEGPGAKENAVTTEVRCISRIRRRESGLIRGYRKACSAFVKIRCRKWYTGAEDVFSRLRGFIATALKELHNLRNGALVGLFCLECAAIFRHVEVTVRCRLGTIQTK